jgi:predicted nucleic acid-binding protein
MSVLVDTSVWSLALRRHPRRLNVSEQAIVKELTDLVQEGRTRILGVVRQELLSGIREDGQFERLRITLRAFPGEELKPEDYEEAAIASNKCRGKGIAVSPVDMLICAIAMSRDWDIFSTDPDFKRYAGVLSVRLHTVR